MVTKMMYMSGNSEIHSPLVNMRSTIMMTILMEMLVSKWYFLNCANWIVLNTKDQGNYSVLEFDFDWPYYHIKVPWKSGMAQSVAIQTLIRAYAQRMTGNILVAAEKLTNSFYINVSEEGCHTRQKMDYGLKNMQAPVLTFNQRC